MLPQDKYSDTLSDSYRAHLEAAVQQGRADFAAGRVRTPEEVRNRINRTLLNEVKRYERQIA